MGKRVSPAVIGAFVVSSFAILIVALIVVGSGRMFTKPIRFICMFQGNLNGLKIGAPVKVRGVQIGTVAAIELRLLPSQGRLRPGIKGLRLPVIIDVDRSQVLARGATGEALEAAGFDDWIKKGMRAQLATESLLTGLLYIDLDLHPNTPIKFVLEPDGPYREIPTVQTDLAQLQERLTEVLDKFDKIDFQALVVSITDAANSIRTLTGSPELKATLESLKGTIANLNQAVNSARDLINNANAKVGPLVTDIRESSEEANKTMKETRAALVSLQQTLDPNSPLAVHLNQTLDSLTETSESLGEFTDYLQRNPGALIRGRYVPDKDKSP
jgi:phospholipid/cholesterol/gamma-HCH transport system substrate-binding protein